MNYLIKSKFSSRKIILFYYINILILLLYSIYKNGYLLYRNNLISQINMFKPLLLVLLTIFITYFIDYVLSKKKYNNIFEEDYNPVYMSLITLALPLNINIFNLLIVIVIIDIIINLVPINEINIYNITKLIIVISIFLLGYYEYKNIYELNIDTSINTFDMFMGRSIGGIGTTNHFLMIICFIIFLFIPSYKKEIPIIALLTYFSMIILFLLFNQNIVLNIRELINSEFLYGIIFIATIPNYSPIVLKDRVVYGIIVGTFSFIATKLINPYEGVFVGIFIANLLMYSLYKVRNLKYENK